MAKKSGGQKVFGLYKKTVKDYCIECGAPAERIKVARTSWTKSQGIPSGLLWRCTKDETHINRTRKYEVVDVRVR